MAKAPAHRFGQIIGDLLEEIMGPELQAFCDDRGLYLDKKGERGEARDGKLVTWLDKYDNTHNLDFVIEKDGTKDKRGRPVAFIEAAWRRYTKHSRNKAQEIQGAVLPIAEKYDWDKPFLGVILAGVFTDGSLTQMKSAGFEIMLFPYETIIKSFAVVKINAEFNEDTPDSEFEDSVKKIEALSDANKDLIKKKLVELNKDLLTDFFTKLENSLDRKIEKIILFPLHGKEASFANIDEAIKFISKYDQGSNGTGEFRKYEIFATYNNNDSINASFVNKTDAIGFLRYLSGDTK